MALLKTPSTVGSGNSGSLGVDKSVPTTNPDAMSPHQHMLKILAEFGNQESDIPPNHLYWDLVNQVRTKGPSNLPVNSGPVQTGPISSGKK